MPIYEFRCRSCGKRLSVLTRSVAERVEPACPACGGRDLDRLVSRFAVHKTLQQVHEEYGPPPKFPTLDYYKDPRNIGRYVEERFRQFGMEVPEPVKEQIQAAREGELPKELDL